MVMNFLFKKLYYLLFFYQCVSIQFFPSLASPVIGHFKLKYSPDFLKKILKGSETRKKADNFLTQQDMLAGRFNNPAGLPQDLYEAIMRQYGRKEFGDYTTRDAKMIINAQKSGLI